MGALHLEPLDRVGGVVDDLELAVPVEVAVAALDVAVRVALLVAEGPVVAGDKGSEIIRIFSDFAN